MSATILSSKRHTALVQRAHLACAALRRRLAEYTLVYSAIIACAMVTGAMGAGTMVTARVAEAQAMQPAPDEISIAEDTLTDVVEEIIEEVEGPRYALQLVSITPVARARKAPAQAMDTVAFTIVNSGTDSSAVARLLVSEKGSKHTLEVGHVVVPRIAPGGRLTLRVPVPKAKGLPCYVGRVDVIPEPDTERIGR